MQRAATVTAHWASLVSNNKQGALRLIALMHWFHCLFWNIKNNRTCLILNKEYALLELWLSSNLRQLNDQNTDELYWLCAFSNHFYLLQFWLWLPICIASCLDSGHAACTDIHPALGPGLTHLLGVINKQSGRINWFFEKINLINQNTLIGFQFYFIVLYLYRNNFMFRG